MQLKHYKKEIEEEKLLEAVVSYLRLVIQEVLHKLRNTNTKVFLDYADDIIREPGGKPICSRKNKEYLDI